MISSVLGTPRWEWRTCRDRRPRHTPGREYIQASQRQALTFSAPCNCCYRRSFPTGDYCPIRAADTARPLLDFNRNNPNQVFPMESPPMDGRIPTLCTGITPPLSSSGNSKATANQSLSETTCRDDTPCCNIPQRCDILADVHVEVIRSDDIESAGVRSRFHIRCLNPPTARSRT